MTLLNGRFHHVACAAALMLACALAGFAQEKATEPEKPALSAEVCPLCKGMDLSRQTCPVCKGVDRSKEPCSLCGGTTTKKKCYWCKGKRTYDKKPCFVCAGTGFERPCYVCNGTGKKPACGECHGTGKHPPCVFCKGSGKLEGVQFFAPKDTGGTSPEDIQARGTGSTARLYSPTGKIFLLPYESDYVRFFKAQELNDTHGMNQIAVRAFAVSSGVKVLVLDVGTTDPRLREVRIQDGSQEGKSGWLMSSYIRALRP